MLRIYRKYAAWIAFTVVIFFVATMFTGAALFGGLDTTPTASAPKVIDKDAIAYYDDFFVSSQLYQTQLNRLFPQYPQDQLQFDPEVQERLSLQALQAAVEFQALLTLARSKKVRISSNEFDLGLQELLINYELEDETALKELLAKQNVSYKDFKSSYKNDLLTRKMMRVIMDDLTLSDRDFEYAFDSLSVFQVKIPKSLNEQSTDSGRKVDPKKVAFDIYEAIKNGQNLDALQADKVYSGLDFQRLNNLRYFSLDSLRRDIVFDLSIGEVSEPIEKKDTYYVYLLENRRRNPVPTSVDEEQLKSQLLEVKKTQQLSEALRSVVAVSDLTIVPQTLLAASKKFSSKPVDAVSLYQVLVSQAPSQPLPYYLLGSLYQQLGQLKDAKTTWEKGSIVAGLHDGVLLPILHLKLGTIYQKNRQYTKMKDEFNKALTMVSQNKSLAQSTQAYFKSQKFNQYAKKAEQVIAKIEADEAKQNALKQELEDKANPVSFENPGLEPSPTNLEPKN